MAIRTARRSVKQKSLLKQARINLITRTARVWSQIGKKYIKELESFIQPWIRKIFREAEKNIATGASLNYPDIPQNFDKTVFNMTRAAMANAYWLQHIYMRECEAAVTGKKFRLKINLSDAVILDDTLLKNILSEFSSSNAFEMSSDWHAIIPEQAIEWLKGYIPSLSGNLQRDILKKTRDVILNSMQQGAPLAQRIKDLKASEPEIAAMTKHRIETIARTEITRADTMGRLIGMFNNRDVVGVEFSAILDDRTTKICAARHGLIMRLDDPKLPSNTPPLHPNCRSILLPATVYEYPDGVVTAHEFEEAPVSIQRTVDVEEINKLLESIRAHIDELKAAEPEKISIPEAATIEEANKIAIEYGIAKNADFSDIDVSAANELIAGVVRTKEIFPELETFDFVGSSQKHSNSRAYTLAKRAFYNNPEYHRRNHPGLSDEEVIEAMKKSAPKWRFENRVWAISSDGYGYVGISLNKNSFTPKTIEETYDSLVRGVKDRFHPIGCDTVKSIIDHEMGHKIDTLLEASQDEKIKIVYQTGQRLKKITEQLSEYAKTNIAEFIAEAWSEYCNNPEPRPLAKFVGERLIELRKEKFNK